MMRVNRDQVRVFLLNGGKPLDRGHVDTVVSWLESAYQKGRDDTPSNEQWDIQGQPGFRGRDDWGNLKS